jgi:hypothetical protein
MAEQQIAWIINEMDTVSDPELNKPKKITKVDGHVVADAVAQEMEEKNRNGRFYGKEDLSPQITCPRTQELIKTGTLRAESGHPDSKELARQQKIEKSNCSAIFLNLWIEDNFVMCRYRGTNNALGKELEQDLLDGFLQAFSLRALGSVVNTGRGAEVKNIRFITYDEVIYPSHPRAYTKGIVSGIKESASKEDVLKEDVNYIKNDKGIFVPITNNSVINYIKESSANFKTIKECFDIYYDNIKLLENGHQIQLNDKTGNIIIVECEKFITNEIMDYCNKF